MNRRIKRAAAALMAVMLMGSTAFAEFTDMPGGETGEALKNAVNAGLMNGVTETEIEPDSYITRAQMATIIARAFGAMDAEDAAFNDVGNLSFGNGYTVNTAFNDISGDEWYATAVEKAVRMCAFQGDADNNFNPTNNITFQETYTVLSRVFNLTPRTVRYSDGRVEILEDVPITVLDGFSDKSQVADWAVDYTAYIVGNGGWTGIDGKLMPTEYITRGQFALLMDKLVAEYIDEPGTYTESPDGLIMVRTGGVVLDGITTDRNIIATYGVDEKGFTLKNSTVNAALVLLGGADKTPSPKSGSGGDYLADDIYTSLEGSYVYDLRILPPYIGVDASSAKKIEYTYGVKGSLVMFPTIG